MRKRARSERRWMLAASATPSATLMAGSCKIQRTVSASVRRMRCCLSSRFTVDLRSRPALAGVGALAQSSRNHVAAVVLGARDTEPVAQAVELFGIDCIHDEPSIDQRIDDRSVWYFNCNGDRTCVACH